MVEEVLIVKSGNSYYGIDTECVGHILRLLPTTFVPLSPKSIRGLCAVEGNIIAVVDFLSILTNGASLTNEQAEASRLVSISYEGIKYTLLVDEVVNSIPIETEYLEDVSSEENTYIDYMYRYNDEIIQIVSVNAMLQSLHIDQFAKNMIKERTHIESAQENLSDLERYLQFRMQNELFAIKVDLIREIISLPDEMTQIADASHEVMGMMQLRDELLLIVDLRRYYDLEGENTTKTKILLVRNLNKVIGLIVDEIVDIKELQESQIDKLPENFKDKKISGVAKIDNAMVSFIDEEVVVNLIAEQSQYIQNKQGNTFIKNTETNSTEVVIFELVDEEYAINVSDVNEILDLGDVTPVASTSEYIDGVTNIRGQIIPVLSLNKRVGLRESSVEEKKVIVCKLDNSEVGFIVDRVVDIFNVENSLIGASQEQDELFTNVINLDNGERLVLIMDLDKIFNEKVKVFQ